MPSPLRLVESCHPGGTGELGVAGSLPRLPYWCVYGGSPIRTLRQSGSREPATSWNWGSNRNDVSGGRGLHVRGTVSDFRLNRLTAFCSRPGQLTVSRLLAGSAGRHRSLVESLQRLAPAHKPNPVTCGQGVCPLGRFAQSRQPRRVGRWNKQDRQGEWRLGSLPFERLSTEASIRRGRAEQMGVERQLTTRSGSRRMSLTHKNVPDGPTLSKRIADWAVAHLIFSLLRLLRPLPHSWAIAFGGWFGRMILAPVSPANRIGRENLRHAFPDLTELERNRILQQCWDNLGKTCVEYLYISDIASSGAGMFNRRVEIEGGEAIDILRQNSTPSIICSAHLGNWEILAACAAASGLDMAALYRPPNNRYISERLMSVRSAAMGPLISSKGHAALKLAALLERGTNVGIMIDQHFGRGVASSFFGRPALTNPIAAVLARRFEYPVFAARCIRLARGRFRLELIGPIEMPRDQSGAVAVGPAMQKLNDIVEAWVREEPGQWLWIHRRWRPEAMPPGRKASREPERRQAPCADHSGVDIQDERALLASGRSADSGTV
jgi:KDO2-lipid IV(A) lauroyltransferase